MYRKKMTHRRIIFFLVIAGFLFSLSALFPSRVVAGLDIRHPVSGCIFPLDFPVPEIRWEDSGPVPEFWNVRIEFNDTGPAITEITDQPYWRPKPELWQRIQQRTVNNAAVIKVFRNDGDSFSGDRVIFQTVDTRLTEPVLVQEKSPAPLDVPHLRLRLSEISETPGRTMDVFGRAMDGVYEVNGAGTHMVFMPPSGDRFYLLPLAEEMFLEPGCCFYAPTSGWILSDPALSPNGTRVVAVVGTAVSKKTNNPETTDGGGALYMWDTRTGCPLPVPGADDPLYRYATPSWASDGIWLYFSRAPRNRMVNGSIRWSLMRLRIQETDTQRPIPVLRSANRHFTHPSPSPDGRWIICRQQTENPATGNGVCGSLVILPSQGGRERQLFCNRSCRHPRRVSWSVDSQWILFNSGDCSNGDNIWISHIDSYGNDSPPVRWDGREKKNIHAVQARFINIGRSPGHLNLYSERRPSQIAVRQGAIASAGGRYDAAVKYYLKAFELDHLNREAAEGLISASIETGQYATAVTTIRQLLKIDENVPGIWFQWARCLRYTNPEDALEKIKAGILLDPENPDGLKMAAEIEADRGNPEQSIRYFTRYLNRIPGDTVARSRMARLLAEEGYLELAISELKRMGS